MTGHVPRQVTHVSRPLGHPLVSSLVEPKDVTGQDKVGTRQEVPQETGGVIPETGHVTLNVR